MGGVNKSDVQSIDPGQAAYIRAQQNQSKLDQSGLSGLTRLLNGGIGNIGHTDMPPMPTYQPRFQGGMFSGMLSDPWHQYLAQKEYENRRDRAIANQLDELYLRKLMMSQNQMGLPNGGNSSSEALGTNTEGTSTETVESLSQSFVRDFYTRLLQNAKNLSEASIKTTIFDLNSEYRPKFQRIAGNAGDAQIDKIINGFDGLASSIITQNEYNFQKNSPKSNPFVVQSMFNGVGVSTDSDVMQSVSKNIADNYHKLSIKKDTSFDQLFGVDITPNAWDKLGQYFLNTVPGANLGQDEKALIYSALQTLTQELGGKTDADKEAAIKTFLEDASKSTDDIQTMKRNPWWFNDNTNIKTLKEGLRTLYTNLPQQNPFNEYYTQQNEAYKQKALYETLSQLGRLPEEDAEKLKETLSQFDDRVFIKGAYDKALEEGLKNGNPIADFRVLAGLDTKHQFKIPANDQQQAQYMEDLYRNIDNALNYINPNSKELLKDPAKAENFLKNSVMFTNQQLTTEAEKTYYNLTLKNAMNYLSDKLQNKEYAVDKTWSKNPVAQVTQKDIQKNINGFNGHTDKTAEYITGILGAAEGFKDTIYQDGRDVNSRTGFLGIRLDMHAPHLKSNFNDPLIKEGKLTDLGEIALKTQTNLMKQLWNKGFGGHHTDGNNAAQDIIKAMKRHGEDYDMDDQEKFNAIILSIYWRGDQKHLKSLHDFMIEKSKNNSKEPLHKLALEWYSDFAQNNPVLRGRYKNLKRALNYE